MAGRSRPLPVPTSMPVLPPVCAPSMAARNGKFASLEVVTITASLPSRFWISWMCATMSSSAWSRLRLHELVRTALAGPLEGRLHAARAVDVLDLRDALQADRLVAIVNAVVRLHLHQTAVAHRAAQGTHAAAVLLVIRACDALLAHGRMLRSRRADARVGLRRREPAFGREHAGSGQAAGSEGTLEETTPRQLPCRSPSLRFRVVFAGVLPAHSVVTRAAGVIVPSTEIGSPSLCI